MNVREPQSFGQFGLSIKRTTSILQVQLGQGYLQLVKMSILLRMQQGEGG